MHPARTIRRLNDGEEALSLQTKPLPDTLEKLQDLRGKLHDGIVALQSLDDLGSEDANQRAWDDMLELQSRYTQVEAKIAEHKK